MRLIQKPSLALLMALVAVPVAAQMPRPLRAVQGPTDVTSFLNGGGVFTRVVTVDGSGRGQFKTISAALAFVGTKTRGANARWLVLVYPGAGGGYLTGLPSAAANWSYRESSTLAVPSFTTVQGMDFSYFNGGDYPGPGINILLTAPSGNLVTMGANTTLINLGLHYWGAASAATTIVYVNGGSVGILQNCSVVVGATVPDTSPIDLVKVAAGSAGYMFWGNTKRFGTATQTRNIVSESSSGFSLYAGRHAPGTSQAKLMETTGSGILKLFNTRIDTGATQELAKSGGTIEAHGAAYNVSNQLVDDRTLRADTFVSDGSCAWKSGAGSPEGVLTAPVCWLYTRTDGGTDTTLYVKESGTGNTGWVAK